MPLGTTPKIDPFCRINPDNTGMGFYVALMAHRYRIGALYNDISSLKSRVGLPDLHRDRCCQVGRFFGFAVGKAIAMQNGGTIGECLVHICNRGQHLVNNFNGGRRFGCQSSRCRCNSSNRLGVKQDLPLGHHHGNQVFQRDGAFSTA